MNEYAQLWNSGGITADKETCNSRRNFK